jgi:hypothetical protein
MGFRLTTHRAIRFKNLERQLAALSVGFEGTLKEGKYVRLTERFAIL